jgi:hypothetical protein
MLAKIASLIQNISATMYASEGKSPELLAPSFFMPVWDPEEQKKIDQEEQRKQSVVEMKNILFALAKSHNEKEAKRVRVRVIKPNNK